MGEEDIIAGCVNGNKKAQEILYHKYAKTLLACCMRYSRSREDAEDALMETFIKVFKNIHKFKHQGAFEGWIKRIATHTAIDKYNKQKVYHEQLNEDIHDAQIDDGAFSNLDAQTIYDMIAKLPDGYRFVFNLHVLEGMPHKDIAKLLDIEEVTSRSQLLKAKKILKKQIKQIYI